MSKVKHKCSADVPTPGMGIHTHACTRWAVHHEDGKWWCQQHTPSAVRSRRDTRDRKRRAVGLDYAQTIAAWDRTLLCEQACAGIADPAAAIRDAREAISILLYVISDDMTHEQQGWRASEIKQARAALALLNGGAS